MIGIEHWEDFFLPVIQWFYFDVFVSDGFSPVSSVFSNLKRPAASRIRLNSMQNACTSINKSCTLIILFLIKDWRKTQTRRTRRFWNKRYSLISQKMLATKSVKGLSALSSATEAFQQQFSFSSNLVPKLYRRCPYSSISHITTACKKWTPLLYSRVPLDTRAFSRLIPCTSEAPDLPVHLISLLCNLWIKSEGRDHILRWCHL